MAKPKKRTDDCILVIDAGTQSIRATMIDMKGNIHDMVKTIIDPYFSDHPGWAEQDPNYYWKVLTTTCKKLMKTTVFSKEAIKGVTITTQRNTMVNLDKDGEPLRPAIVWLDQRKAANGPWPPIYLKAALKIIGLKETVMHAQRECEINWLKQNQPEIWEKTDKYVFLSGFFTYKLTGKHVDSTANIVGYVPFDYKEQNWCKDSDLKWKLFPVEKSKLPSLVKPTEQLGEITKEAAKATGIPLGLPIIAAAADKACEVLGSGVTTKNIACLSYGTTATIETTSDKYTEIIPFLPSYPSAIPGCYNTEVMIFRGYWMVSWFKKEFGHKEEQLAKKKNVVPEILFDELVKDIPPGSMGLTLQPYWSPGIKIPGPEAKGAIIGFGDVHTKGHIYRAVLEGLAYGLKDGLIKTEKKNKTKIDKLMVSGGGSQSDVAMQLTADIFNLPAERPHTFETSALGAAIDAAVGLKLFNNFESATKAMTRTGDVFHPIPENVEIYKELFEKIYLKMYNKLQPLYNDIRDITDYPKKH
jgi:sugar (pentulose or hexulose) kinase